MQARRPWKQRDVGRRPWRRCKGLGLDCKEGHIKSVYRETGDGVSRALGTLRDQSSAPLYARNVDNLMVIANRFRKRVSVFHTPFLFYFLPKKRQVSSTHRSRHRADHDDATLALVNHVLGGLSGTEVRAVDVDTPQKVHSVRRVLESREVLNNACK